MLSYDHNSVDGKSFIGTTHNVYLFTLKKYDILDKKKKKPIS